MASVDRRVAKSREAIKTALVALMADKKFEHITMQDISDKANVGRRTIYLHYQDKYDLLDRLVMEHIEALRTICEAAEEASFAEGSLAWFGYFERNKAFFAAMLRSREAASFRSRFLDYVTRRLEHYVDIAQGVNEGLSKEIVLRFLGTAIVGLVESWLAGGLSEPIGAVAKQLGLLLDRNL
ncbi:TetR/AcrR family transcriptional regulator [Paenibacillus sp. MWE-103]|uniref:TetR/AcrR family transcriptional regulator n=1 Tax=Paenibacillus artemisiicola TaxID=1172618 RepID=A0ABS3W4G0_9BACL|nr:TetR/AcrR family transcriptional regulator [Paenibacillus artemisiicola]MBO7743035.1 TetR/AcrR family transcriptional regulator [Paenibacillus artemisiicola]